MYTALIYTLISWAVIAALSLIQKALKDYVSIILSLLADFLAAYMILGSLSYITFFLMSIAPHSPIAWWTHLVPPVLVLARYIARDYFGFKDMTICHISLFIFIALNTIGNVVNLFRYWFGLNALSFTHMLHIYATSLFFSWVSVISSAFHLAKDLIKAQQDNDLLDSSIWFRRFIFSPFMSISLGFVLFHHGSIFILAPVAIAIATWIICKLIQVRGFSFRALIEHNCYNLARLWAWFSPSVLNELNNMTGQVTNLKSYKLLQAEKQHVDGHLIANLPGHTSVKNYYNDQLLGQIENKCPNKRYRQYFRHLKGRYENNGETGALDQLYLILEDRIKFQQLLKLRTPPPKVYLEKLDEQIRIGADINLLNTWYKFLRCRVIHHDTQVVNWQQLDEAVGSSSTGINGLEQIFNGLGIPHDDVAATRNQSPRRNISI